MQRLWCCLAWFGASCFPLRVLLLGSVAVAALLAGFLSLRLVARVDDVFSKYMCQHGLAAALDTVRSGACCAIAQLVCAPFRALETHAGLLLRHTEAAARAHSAQARSVSVSSSVVPTAVVWQCSKCCQQCVPACVVAAAVLRPVWKQRLLYGLHSGSDRSSWLPLFPEFVARPVLGVVSRFCS